MRRFAVINKQVGETPLEAMEAWRTTEGLKKDIPLAYAGRLDPMASGTLIVLIGEECKRQKSYQAFDKEYRFEVLVGFRSDTGDILGIAQRSTNTLFTEREHATNPTYAVHVR
jgi:tRNA U55 pseudouridine synthase TruB